MNSELMTEVNVIDQSKVVLCELENAAVPMGHGIAHGEWNFQYIGPEVSDDLMEEPAIQADLETKGLSPTSAHPHYVICQGCQTFVAAAEKRHPLVPGYIFIQQGGSVVITSENHGTARIAAPGLWAIRAQRDGELQAHGVMVVNID
jgi:hypothetical protein